MIDEDAVSVNSFIMEPPKQQTKRFSLRKRKQNHSDNCDDTASVTSLTIDEPAPSKRKRVLSKVSSLANLFSTPVKPLSSAKNALQRSISGVWNSPSTAANAGTPLRDTPVQEKMSSPSTLSIGGSPALRKKRTSVVSLNQFPGILVSSSNLTPYRPPQPTPTKQRVLKLWSETWGIDTALTLSSEDVKRQEAIYELWQGECDLVDDLQMLEHTYHDSLLQLRLLNPEEAQKIFGGLETLSTIHRELRDQLFNAKLENGCIDLVGGILLQWVPRLNAYIEHCARQVEGKSVLDEKRAADPRVEDFLKRCLESPFSRRLDVWSYLDVPRSRLVKYPLLLRQILKYTSENHQDYTALPKALELLSSILSSVDKATGQARCKQAVSRIDVTGEQRVLVEATNLLCEGALKTANGIKVQCYLFDTGLVVTRPQPNTHRVIMYKAAIPAESMTVEDLGTKVGRSNSFMPGSSNTTTSSKHVFKVASEAESLTLVTQNEHNKKQWLQGLQKVVKEAQIVQETVPDKGPELFPKIKPNLEIRGTHRKRFRGSDSAKSSKLQVMSAPDLHDLRGSKVMKKKSPNSTSRLLRSKGSICLLNTLSPKSHPMCTRSCTSLRYAPLHS